jgi:hypothetical protein
MMLEDGRTYRNGWGDRHTIAGTCKEHPEWCYTNGGEWFVRATGQALRYNDRTGTHYAAAENTWYTLAHPVPQSAM